MPIVVNLDVMKAKRKMPAGELAERIGITPANLSILKNQIDYDRQCIPLLSDGQIQFVLHGDGTLKDVFHDAHD